MAVTREQPELQEVRRCLAVQEVPVALPMELPAEVVRAFLIHPLPELRQWCWRYGGEEVVSTALVLVWEELNRTVLQDLVQVLGRQVVYESYYYFSSRTVTQQELVLQSLEVIGYPSLAWAVTTDWFLGTLALRNPTLTTEELANVSTWVAEHEETQHLLVASN